MTKKNRSGMFWYLALPTLVLVACALQPVPARAQMTSLGIDCSQIPDLGIWVQDNLGAGAVLIECGMSQGGSPDEGEEAPLDAPPTNVNLITGTETFPNVTQSESMVWASSDANTIVVNYNDSRGRTATPIQLSGISFSTDGGATFTRIGPTSPRSGRGNFGDPVVVFNDKLNKWFAGDLTSGGTPNCGGQGIGMWTSNDGVTWAVGACAHVGAGDDRESMWVDNNPASPWYGRMYISWNNFSVACGSFIGCIFATHSDDGTTWSAPVRLNNVQGAPSIRNVQITGAPAPAPGAPVPPPPLNGTVFVAGMDEGTGGTSTRQNWMFRSTDGGNTWSGITIGGRFNPVGDANCTANTYFRQVNPLWRHMGWGEPGVGPGGVVHYAYAGLGTAAGDTGDIFYVRSTDNGATWSAPIKLNDDATTRTQWMPSLSVSNQLDNNTGNEVGKVTVSWYDRRSTTGMCRNLPFLDHPGCDYERWGVQSADNGATFGANFVISSVIIPQPAQPDPGIVSCYAGDYDYATALRENAYVTWTDGRVVVSGQFQQDVFFAQVPEP